MRFGLEFWSWPTSVTFHTLTELMSSVAYFPYVVGDAFPSWDVLILRNYSWLCIPCLGFSTRIDRDYWES
jgi:hypothetical protein